MTKSTRIEIAETIDKLRLLLLLDEREHFLNRSNRAALGDCRSVLQAVVMGELRPEARSA